jgi:cytokinin dehydrogenase
VHAEDDDAAEFAARYDVRFEAMRALGAWQQLHPWLECLLPLEAAEQLLPRILERLPLLLGDGHRVSWVSSGSQGSSVVCPEQSRMLALAILPLGVVNAVREPMLGALADVERSLLDAGGKRYLSGWLFGRDQDAWRRHYGPQYADWKQRKEWFDPRHILRSDLLPE